ncbi:MAG: sugar phosphate isomerase [Herbinix sp.]|nr:sugar phosphate isomerase [Herbinix sp.]
MKTKIASPLYILREECAEDLYGVLKKIKNLGFDGVEFLGFFGKDPKEISLKLKELNLTAIGNHVDYEEFKKDTDGVISSHKELGCNYITITGPNKQLLPDSTVIDTYIKDVTRIGKLCKDSGITLLYHNHDHELKYNIGESYLLEEILDRVPAEILSYEIDLGWIAIGGGDPAYFLDKYQKRCPIIHLKDFYAEDIKHVGNVHELGPKKGDENYSYFEFRPVGYGIANLPAFAKQIQLCNPEWLLADHDLAYERDSYEDLKISLEYIKNLQIMS